MGCQHKFSSAQPSCAQPGAVCWLALGLGTLCLGSLNTHEMGGRHDQHMKTNCSFPGKHELISLLPLSPDWRPGQMDPPFLPIHWQSPSLPASFSTSSQLYLTFQGRIRSLASRVCSWWPSGPWLRVGPTAEPPPAGVRRGSLQPAVPSGSSGPGIQSV